MLADRRRDGVGFGVVARDDHRDAALKDSAGLQRFGGDLAGGDLDAEHRPLAHGAVHRDGSAHGIDDALRDREPEAGPAMLARRRSVGLLELLEYPFHVLGAKPRSRIGDTERDRGLFGRPAEPDGHRNAAGVGELDRIAEQVEKHLPKPAGVCVDGGRDLDADMHAETDILAEGARGKQLGDILHQLAHGYRLGIEIEPPGLDLGIVEQVVDQRQKRRGGGRHGADIGVLLRRQPGIGQQPGHPHDAVHGRADFVADGGQEAGLGLVRRLGPLPCPHDRGLGPLARRDIARYRAMRDGAADIVADRLLDPGEPSDALGGMDRHVGRGEAFAVRKGRIRHDADLDAEFGQGIADDVARRTADEPGKHAVGVDNDAIAIAVDDDVAQRVVKPAKALLAFLQFPDPVGKLLHPFPIACH